MKVDVQELNAEHYILLDKLAHDELHLFLNDKLKMRKKWFFYVYMIILIVSLGSLSYTVTKNLMIGTLDFVQAILYILLGIGITMLFIPLHELLHYIAYKIAGAKSVTFISNIKKFYFATVAHKFVANLSEFTFIAILPFSVVLIGTLVSLPFLPLELQLTAITVLAVHNMFCSGDFTLLNYLASNRGMVTYDDTELGETYFYKTQEK